MKIDIENGGKYTDSYFASLGNNPFEGEGIIRLRGINPFDYEFRVYLYYDGTNLQELWADHDTKYYIYRLSAGAEAVRRLIKYLESENNFNRRPNEN